MRKSFPAFVKDDYKYMPNGWCIDVKSRAVNDIFYKISDRLTHKPRF